MGLLWSLCALSLLVFRRFLEGIASYAAKVAVVETSGLSWHSKLIDLLVP